MAAGIINSAIGDARTSNQDEQLATATAATAPLPAQPTVAAAPAGIISTAQAAPVDYKSQINGIYQSSFGRQPDDAGMAYWTKAAQQNPGGDLSAMIKGGAQTQDRAAMADISAGGIDTTKTWGAGLNPNDVAPSKDIWNATSNQWTPAPTAPVSAQLSAPTKWGVTADQTVQGQMKSLIDPNNPYYQQWATAGAQEAAARGFTGNSSIRSTGIMDAVMRGATPIATSDASTYAKAAGYNADTSNQFAVKNADMSNQMAMANLSASTQTAVAGMSAQTQRAVSTMNNVSQAAISQAHDANSALISSNDSAKSAYSNYVAAVAQIDQNDKMTGEGAKRAAIITQTQIFNNAIAGLRAANSGTADVSSPLNIAQTAGNPASRVGGVDVSNLLNFQL